MVAYFCALVQALMYFWGIASLPFTENNSKILDFGCYNTFIKTFMDNKFDSLTYSQAYRFEYMQIIKSKTMWAIILGDKLIFIGSVLFETFRIYLNHKVYSNRTAIIRRHSIN